MAKDFNHRLAAALEAAKQKPKLAKAARGSFTSRTASKARRLYLATHTFAPTVSMKIQADCAMLAKSAWKNCHERVSECSTAIRERALRKLQNQPQD